MNRSEESLSKALRELAAASPQGAPPELGFKLRDAFARHHSRRRQKRVALMTGLAICVAVWVAWLQVGKHPRPDTVANELPRTVGPSAVPPAVAARAPNATVAPAVIGHAGGAKVRSKTNPRTHSGRTMTSAPVIDAGDFVALPLFDPAIPLGQSRMVRVELPGSALQLIGYPVNEELLQRRVLTDVLVGQDGVPYAVRLVQTRAVH